MPEHPQFYTNTLEVPPINENTLRQTLEDLRSAVINGVNIIESGDTTSGHYDGRGVFAGELGRIRPTLPYKRTRYFLIILCMSNGFLLGIALTYLRLAQQAPSLAESADGVPNFFTLSGARIPEHGPDIPLQIGGLSPLPSKSPIAALVLRVLHKTATGHVATISNSDVTTLSDAVEMALSHGSTGFYHGHNLGADEVLFGRAGLLWALLNIRSRMADCPAAEKKTFSPILDTIPQLMRSVIDAGREGSAEYTQAHGETDALPLMWKWMPGHYGIGW